jgi:hypothetical protein
MVREVQSYLSWPVESRLVAQNIPDGDELPGGISDIGRHIPLAPLAEYAKDLGPV